MGYMLDLRKYVGKKCLIQVAASIIIINSKGEILLGKRADNGMWGYAGGSMEIDEKPEECAKRELYEEMGLIANEITLFMINAGKETHYTYPNGDEVSNVEIIYLCNNYQGEIKAIDRELTELKFFKIDNLPEISPPIRPVFVKLKEYLK